MVYCNSNGGCMMYYKLKQMRYKKNVLAKDIARSIGISKAYYCQIENGKRRLYYEMAFKIANFFGVKPDSLFYEDTCKHISEKDISE